MIKVGTDQIERWLKGLAIICSTLLLLVQAALFCDETRLYLSRVDRLEGEKITLETAQYAANPLSITERSVVSKRIPAIRESKVLIIRMVQPAADSRVFVTISGERGADFNRGDIKVTVYDGDYIEIDCSALRESAKFVVNVPGAGIASPVDGLIIESQEGIATVGKIKFR